MRSFEEINADVLRAISVSDVETLLRCTVELDAIGIPQAEALASRSRGIALSLRGDSLAALPHYQRALAIYEDLADQNGVAITNGNIGSAYGTTGDYPTALVHHKRALAIYEGLGNRRGIAFVTGNIGFVLSSTGDYPAALEHYHRAMALTEELGERSDMARIVCNIGNIHLSTGDYSTALSYYNRALALHEELGDRNGVATVTTNIGNVNRFTANYPVAIDHYHRALALFQDLGHRNGMANTWGSIAIVHVKTGDYPAALEHYYRAQVVFEELKDRKGLAITTGNIGNIHRITGDYPAALTHYLRALTLHEELGERSGVARVTGNIGTVHFSTGDYIAALEHYRRALTIHEELGEHSSVAHITHNIAETYLAMDSDGEAQVLMANMDAMQLVGTDVRINLECLRSSLLERSGDLDGATITLQHALAEALEHNLRSSAAAMHRALRDIAQKRNDFASYIEHNNEYTRITEEINGKETATKLAMQAKQREIDAREKEHQKHLAVLHSTLPKHIADRVARGETVNDNYDDAAILFLDIVSFSSYTSNMPPTDVVKMLELLFTTVDGICETHSVVKIKTIGDSYMCFRGDADATTNATSIAQVALAAIGCAFAWPDGAPIQFRAGIHIGPATAGVIGTQRLQYDVWGDTVNVASRMESTSEPGKIQISDVLAHALNENKNSPPDPLSHASLERGSYTVAPRGTVDVKGKGAMQTYWLLMK